MTDMYVALMHTDLLGQLPVEVISCALADCYHIYQRLPAHPFYGADVQVLLCNLQACLL